MKVDIKEILTAFEMIGDEVSAFVNKHTGKVVVIHDEDFIGSEHYDENSGVTEWVADRTL